MKVITIDEIEFKPIWENGKLTVTANYHGLRASLTRTSPERIVKYIYGGEFNEDKQYLLSLIQDYLNEKAAK